MNKNLKISYLLGFLVSISIALVSYINSSFLSQFIDKKYEGLIFALASLVTIIAISKITKILSFWGNRHTTTILGFVTFFSLVLLPNTNKSFIAIVSFLTFFVSYNLIVMNLDIFIEDFSKGKNIGKLRGLYLTIANSGWVLAQLVSGKVLEDYSFKGIYLLSSSFILIFLFIIILNLKDFKDTEYKQFSFLKTVALFIKNKDLGNIYLINFILKIFFSWMVIYTPIYLHQNLNLPWDTIGIIFAFMLTPFVFLSFPLGKLSDKIGEKEMLILGFIIMSLSTLFIPFLTKENILLISFVLFLTRIGAATVEIMSESYFFKKIKEENTDELSFFRTNTPLAYIIGPIIATIIIFILPDFKYIFLILSTILLLGVFVSLKLKDTN